MPPISDASSWNILAESPVFGVAATALAYLVGLRLYQMSGKHPLTHPALVAIVLIAVGLEAAGLSYAAYMKGAGFIHFLLGPAVVLLAVPLVRQARLIRASCRIIAVALAVGAMTGVVSAVGFAWLLGGTAEIVLALAPKSVTAGVAIGVSEVIGGVPALTAVVTVMTGITGAMFGPTIIKLIRVGDERAIGLGLGIAAHGIGTARALQISEVAGAFSGLGMGLNGVTTAVLLPLLMTLW